MKVVHVLKRIEAIDQDIKDLKKLEKSITKNKSFSTPIYMTIEKQINILLGDRIKMLELQIDNPPEHLMNKKEDSRPKEAPAPPETKGEKQSVIKKKSKPERSKSNFDNEIPMMTQDDIDAKINSIQKENKAKIKTKPEEKAPTPHAENNDDVKILDIALEKGTINTKEVEKERKVRFFRENFPEE